MFLPENTVLIPFEPMTHVGAAANTPVGAVTSAEAPFTQEVSSWHAQSS